jgi:hypothetical protein
MTLISSPSCAFTQVPLWFPLSIITGGNLAKVVVTAMGNEWGKKMAQSTLTRDLGNALYKVSQDHSECIILWGGVAMGTSLICS